MSPINIIRKPRGSVAIKNHKNPPPPELSSNILPPLKSVNTKAAITGEKATTKPMRTKGILFTQRV
jgi:hypothetical protein